MRNTDERRELEVTPIYNGIMNMTPDRYESIKRAEEYIEKCAEKRQRKIDLIINSLLVGIVVAGLIIMCFTY